MMISNKTVLAIGASGMLLPAVYSLLEAGNTVYLVARRPHVAGHHPNLHCISADWNDAEGFRQKLQSSLLVRKPDVALLWIHTPYRQTLHLAIADLLESNAIIIDVRGSAGSDPPGSRYSESIFGPGRHYRQLILGFVGPRGGPTRWLTDQEISDGAIKAFTLDEKRSVVGRVEPWSDRP